MLGGFGQRTAAPGAAGVGVADLQGHARRNMTGTAEAGAKVLGQGEQDAPVGGRVEFVAGEVVLGAGARRRRGGVDDLGVAALGVLVEGTSGAGAEQTLQHQLGNLGDVADGVQAVLAEHRG